MSNKIAVGFVNEAETKFTGYIIEKPQSMVKFINEIASKCDTIEDFQNSIKSSTHPLSNGNLDNDNVESYVIIEDTPDELTSENLENEFYGDPEDEDDLENFKSEMITDAGYAVVSDNQKFAAKIYTPAWNTQPDWATSSKPASMKGQKKG